MVSTGPKDQFLEAHSKEKELEKNSIQISWGKKKKNPSQPILQSVTKKRGPPTPADGLLIIYELSVGVVSPVLNFLI